MSQPYPSGQPYPAPPGHWQQSPPPGSSARGLLLGIVGLVVGLGLGVGGAFLLFSGDPTDSDEYAALRDDVDVAENRVEELEAGGTIEEPADPTETTESGEDPTEAVPEPGTDDPAAPSPSSNGGDVEIVQTFGYTVTEVAISPDDVEEFYADITVVNDGQQASEEPETMTVHSGGPDGTVVATMSCFHEPIPAGATAEIGCYSVDAYTSDFDTVTFD